MFSSNIYYLLFLSTKLLFRGNNAQLVNWAVVLAIPSPNAYLPDQSILARVGVGDQRHFPLCSLTVWVKLKDQIASFDILSLVKPLVARQQCRRKVLYPANPKFASPVLDTPQ